MDAQERQERMLEIVAKMREILDATSQTVSPGATASLMELLGDVDRALVTGSDNATVLHSAVQGIRTKLSFPPFGATRGATASEDGLSDSRLELQRLWNEFVEVHDSEAGEYSEPPDQVES